MMKFYLLFLAFPTIVLAAPADTLTIAMTGDIMMGTTYPSTMLPPENGTLLFSDAKDFLQQADVAVGNLEGAICDGEESTKGSGPHSYAFRMPLSYAPLLSDAGYDYLSMANNHANDFGKEGIVSTEIALNKEGILFSGLDGRAEYALLQRRGLIIGLCAFGHNAYTLKHTDLTVVERIVGQLVERCDIVIVSFHGGAEGRGHCHLPKGREMFLGEDRGDLRSLAHFCIDLGADVVYGHGPHVPRAVEVYKERFIAYSLGNFCTPYGINLTGISGYAPLIRIGIDREGRFLQGQIQGMKQIRGEGPRTDDSGRVVELIRQLTTSDCPDSEAIIQSDGSILPRRNVKER